MAKKASYSKKIVEAYQAVSHFIVSGAKGMPPQWPFSIIETNWYHAQFLPKEIFTIIKALEKKDFDNQEIAKLLWGPSAVTHWLYIAEHGLGAPEMRRFEGLTVRQAVEFLEKTIDLFSLQRRGNPFCRNWKNLIWSKERVEQAREKAKFIDVSTGSKATRFLSNINTILWQYCILIQVGHRNYSQEFHGPYLLEDGRVLFVRDYFNLRPTEVWKFTSVLPFNKLRILEVYKKGTKIRVDLFNHFEITPSPIKSLQRFSVQVDDAKYLESAKEVRNLFKSCNGVIEKGNEFVRNFDKKDWVKKIIEMRYLWLKPTKEILGQDWKPPSEVYTLVKRIAEAEKATIEWGKRMRKVLTTNISEQKKEEKITQMFLDAVYQKE